MADSPLNPPDGLGASGLALWVAVAEKFVLTPAEVSVLGEACRTADELARLELAVRALPELTTVGSVGQVKAHPLLGEVRAHRVLLDRLTASLNLPDDDQEVGLRAGQRHARTAAMARWRKPAAESEAS